jgi:hypothetical protein
MDAPLTPRDRCTEHLAVVTAWSSLLQRLVLYRALEMLDLRQLNELVAYSNDAEDEIAAGLHGVYHRAVLNRARRQ